MNGFFRKSMLRPGSNWMLAFFSYWQLGGDFFVRNFDRFGWGWVYSLTKLQRIFNPWFEQGSRSPFSGHPHHRGLDSSGGLSFWTSRDCEVIIGGHLYQCWVLRCVFFLLNKNPCRCWKTSTKTASTVSDLLFTTRIGEPVIDVHHSFFGGM